MFKLTVLMENAAARPDLVAEHGWSVLVEAPGTRGLLDTGATGAVVRNAQVLGVDLAGLDWIVLSHGHYDHTGGLPDVLAEAPGARVVAHPHAFVPNPA
ncbi:MAG TPA: MBL fold metallo-hydrolase [Candidatus Hydrogenedentes bacterium]|nr:MBL fold metallo-hydrolase [Candidatus Hydrogenedentota bacterium]